MKSSQICLMCCIIVFIVISLLCHIIALATHYWLKSSDKNQINFLSLGLWTACFDGYMHPHETPRRVYDGCHGLTSSYYETIQDWLVPGWLIVTRGIAIFSLILQIVGIVLVIILFMWIICKWCCRSRQRDFCERFLIYSAPIIWIIAGVFLMMVLMIFADNAFRLQCKDFWVGGNDPNSNHLSISWVFELFACIFSFLTGGFVIWLVVLKARDEI